MKPGIPWSIKGVEPQAREAAKIAARRAGMTLGEWLNTVLLDADDFAPEPDYRPPHRAAGRYETPRYGPEVHERLDELATQIGRLAQRQSETAVSRVVEPKIDLDPLSDLVRGLVDRVERSEKRSIDSMDEFDRRLNRLSDKLIHDIGRGETAGTASTQGFERALKNIVDHIEQNERRHSESFKSIQSKIGDLATKLTTEPARPNIPALSGLERRLGELGERIDRMERRKQELGPVKAIEDRLGHLADQIREQAQTVSSIARAKESAAVDTSAFISRAELQEIQSRIEDIVNRLEDPVLGNPDAAIAQMQDEIASLSRNLADVRIEAASIQDMRALRQAIDNIAAQLADGSPVSGNMDPAIARMQGEIASLSHSIAAMSVGSASGQDVEDIRDGLRQVAEQIQYLQASGGGDDGSAGQLRGEIATINAMIAQIRDEAASVDDIHALRATLEHVASQQGQTGGGSYAALERRIEELARRLDRAGGDGSSIDDITELEARIQELYARIEQAPNGAAGDDAYRTLETQVATLFDRLSAIEHQGGGSPAAGGHYDTAIEALERGLQSVQSSNERSDRRTQETLEAVHETLEKVVNRLARLEEASMPSAGSDPGEPRLAEASYRSAHRERPAPAQEQPAADLRLPPIIGLDEIRDSLAAPARADQRQEAGSPEHRPPERSAPRIGRTDDFIAAARRAAQASPQVTIAETRKKSSILGFLTRRKKSEQSGKDAKSSKLRTVLLAAAVALLAIGALSTIPLTQTRTSKVAVERSDTTMLGSKSSRLGGPDGTMAADPATSAHPAAGGEFDNPINPQSLPSAPGTRKPQAALGRAPGVTDLAKTSLTHAPAAGMPDPPPLPEADPVVTGSIPAGNAAGAGTKDTDRVSMQDSLLSANRSVSVDRTGGDRPSRTAPDAATRGETLPPAEIGPMSLRVAAASGSAAAQYEVAARYTEGRIIAQDFRKAAMWYQRAAAKGMAPAQYRLGTLYEKGRGVPADKAAARIWYERAAEKGNRKAMHNLAVLYADASDGNPNYAKAAMWFRSAAELGLADSQFNYGILAERGLGTRKDLKDAYRWFAIAARNGDKGADERLALVEKDMAPDDLVAVKLQIESWQPREPIKEANIVEIPSGGWGAPASSTAAGPASAAASDGQSTIAEVQTLLNSLGYNVGPADGVLGPRTRDAIRDFERDQGMATTGMVTRNLVEKLNAQPG